MKTPAILAFADAIAPELVFGQVLIRPAGRGFEFRHNDDQTADASTLKLLPDMEIRPLAQFTAEGSFRPLKSAPNLKTGWRIVAADVEALDAVLNQLYPGAVADWFAVRSGAPPITSYREFTGRQTGMYRITTHLEDSSAAAVIRACCHKDFCLKRRLWSVDGLTPDAAPVKSLIPCLEPCAILLEFARKMARVLQEKAMQMPSTDAGVSVNNPAIAETDFDNPLNPRRRRFESERAVNP